MIIGPLGVYHKKLTIYIILKILLKRIFQDAFLHFDSNYQNHLPVFFIMFRQFFFGVFARDPDKSEF